MENHCTFVASRGNYGHSGNPMSYPACLSDVKVLNTGASGTDGEYKTESNGDAILLPTVWSSSYGSNVDFIAPGCTEIVTAPYNPSAPYSWSNTSSLSDDYYTFSGTSAAAPHVSGVAALMYSKHHTTNGAPNNLATEDIEHILQKNATDKGTNGYDQYNGWGLINAYSALDKVAYPSYYVKHSPSRLSTQIPLLNINVVVANNTDNVAAGYYVADRYQVNWTYVDVLPAQHEIIDWWQLEASTYSGVSAANPITGTRWMSVTPNVTIGGNAAVFSVYSFAWFIKTNTLAQTINKWIPAGGPSQLRYAYSLHVKDNATTSIDEIGKDIGLTIFPNPSEGMVNLTFVSSGTESRLEIYDSQGKIVASPNLGYKEYGDHTVSINVGNLTNGMYLIKISTGENIISKKFIKR